MSNGLGYNTIFEHTLLYDYFLFACWYYYLDVAMNEIGSKEDSRIVPRTKLT